MTQGALDDDRSTALLREDRREHSRRHLLRSAAVVLGRCGYAGANLSEIAKASGMSVTAIYHYWSSRDDLVEEVISLGQGETFRRVRAALSQQPDRTSPMDRILVAAEAHLQAVLENLDYVRAAVRNVAQLPAEPQKRHRAAVVAYERLWRVLIDDLHWSGGLSGDLDPEVAVKLVLGTLNSVPEFRASRTGAPADLVTTARRFIRNGLVVRSARPVTGPSHPI